MKKQWKKIAFAGLFSAALMFNLNFDYSNDSENTALVKLGSIAHSQGEYVIYCGDKFNWNDFFDWANSNDDGYYVTHWGESNVDCDAGGGQNCGF